MRFFLASFFTIVLAIDPSQASTVLLKFDDNCRKVYDANTGRETERCREPSQILSVYFSNSSVNTLDLLEAGRPHYSGDYGMIISVSFDSREQAYDFKEAIKKENVLITVYLAYWGWGGIRVKSVQSDRSGSQSLKDYLAVRMAD